MGTSIRLEKELGLSLGEKTNANEQTKTNKTNKQMKTTTKPWADDTVTKLKASC